MGHRQVNHQPVIKLLPLTIEVLDHVYVLGYTYTCHTLCISFSTRSGCILLPCDMYKSGLRHIHDPVGLSLKVEVICFVLSCFPPAPSTFPHSAPTRVSVASQGYRFEKVPLRRLR